MFAKIARFSVRFRWFIIIFWIAAIPVCTALFPNINDVSKTNNSDFLPKNSPTATASRLEQAFQSKETAGNAIIVFSRSDGSQLKPGDTAAAQKLMASVKTAKDVTEVRDTGASADGQAHEYLVGVSGNANGPGSVRVVDSIRDKMHAVRLPSGLRANLTGDLAAAIDAAKQNSNGRLNTERYTVVLIIVLLLLVFRAVLAPLVTLIPAGLALAVSQPVIAEATKVGVQVGFITQILLIVLILGAGTDYGLFLVFRVREELRKGAEPKEAVVKALARVGESITFSAATVVAALLSLLLATFGLYRGLGPALAIALVIMLLIALTFLPALLAILGRAVFWPSKTRHTTRIGLWGRLADRAIEMPKTVLVLGVVLFAGLALGISGYKAGGFGNQSAPKGSDSAIGKTVLDQHFSSANDNPQLLIFKLNRPAWQDMSAVKQIQDKLVASGQFNQVLGPFNVNGYNFTPQMLEQLHAGAPASPLLLAQQQFISHDGRTVQFYGVLKAAKSGSNQAMQAIPAVRASLDQVAKQAGVSENSVFSSDSVAYDVNRVATHDLQRIIPVVLLIIAALLAILLRSLVAPWYLILTVGLSYLASLGFSMIVFVHLGHQDGLFFILPFLMFIFGMALGEDYNILVMSRIREEAHHEKTLPAAVTKAVGITGTTVTSAGLILAGTFTILGLVGGDQSVEQIGYGIAFGVLLDTFFVRTLLVPSIVALLGRYNWWPSKLYHQSKG